MADNQKANPVFAKGNDQKEEDLTGVCLDIVHQVLKSLVIGTEQMPYNLRAMLKILVLKSD